MSYDLNRFKNAQDQCYAQVLEELKSGKKNTHWMWFIFPQIAGLGSSAMAQKYAIANAAEAACYLEDALLSQRLVELTSILVKEVSGKTAEEIFGFPDYLKFHSSMTLFEYVVKAHKIFANNKDFVCFEAALRKYYDGKPDPLTLDILKKHTFSTS